MSPNFVWLSAWELCPEIEPLLVTMLCVIKYYETCDNVYNYEYFLCVILRCVVTNIALTRESIVQRLCLHRVRRFFVLYPSHVMFVAAWAGKVRPEFTRFNACVEWEEFDLITFLPTLNLYIYCLLKWSECKNTIILQVVLRGHESKFPIMRDEHNFDAFNLWAIKLESSLCKPSHDEKHRDL